MEAVRTGKHLGNHHRATLRHRLRRAFAVALDEPEVRQKLGGEEKDVRRGEASTRRRTRLGAGNLQLPRHQLGNPLHALDVL